MAKEVTSSEGFEFVMFSVVAEPVNPRCRIKMDTDTKNEEFDNRYEAAKKLGEVLRTMGAISPNPRRQVICVGAGADALYVYMKNGNDATKKTITEIAEREVPGHALKFIPSGMPRAL